MTDEQTRADIRRLIAGIRVRLPDPPPPGWLQGLAAGLTAYGTPAMAIEYLKGGWLMLPDLGSKYPRAPGRGFAEWRESADKEGAETATLKVGGFIVRYEERH